MKKQILQGIGLTLLAIVVFLGVLLFVQRMNSDLDDINIVINNFQHINRLGTPCQITTTKADGTTTLYSIEDANGTTIIRLDNEWVDNGMKMEVWNTVSAGTSIDDVVSSAKPSEWELVLSEHRLGAFVFYKEIYMNQTAGLNQNTIIEDVLEGNVQ
ncbi:MAG: hypothetical protein IKP66_02355 [Lachnospiraceae bacterium]|jgi:hypothetical protein|nr:hypothetical protein [Lachnospiraceae bacterium]